MVNWFVFGSMWGRKRVKNIQTPIQEVWYYPSMSKEYTREDITGDKLSMKGEAKGMDKDFWESMTTGTGPLVAGALPGLDVQSEKSLADSLTGGKTVKAKAKATANAEAAERVEPATLRERLILCFRNCLCSTLFPKSRSHDENPPYQLAFTRSPTNQDHFFMIRQMFYLSYIGQVKEHRVYQRLSSPSVG